MPRDSDHYNQPGMHKRTSSLVSECLKEWARSWYNIKKIEIRYIGHSFAFKVIVTCDTDKIYILS